MTETSKFLAVDPGGTTGWAIFSLTTKKPLTMGEMMPGEFIEFLEETDVDFYVVEDWMVRPPKKKTDFQHRWDRAIAARMIGTVMSISHRKDRPIVWQQPSIKPMAAQKFNLPNKGSHMMDAVLHGTWYLRKGEVPDVEKQLPTQRGGITERGVRGPTRVAQISSLGGLRAARRTASVEMPEQGA